MDTNDHSPETIDDNNEPNVKILANGAVYDLDKKQIVKGPTDMTALRAGHAEYRERLKEAELAGYRQGTNTATDEEAMTVVSKEVATMATSDHKDKLAAAKLMMQRMAGDEQASHTHNELHIYSPDVAKELVDLMMKNWDSRPSSSEPARSSKQLPPSAKPNASEPPGTP